EIVEDVDEDETREENGQRDTGRDDEARQVVDPGARVSRGQDTQGKRDGDGEGQGRHRQFQGGGQPYLKIREDGLAGGERGAQIAAGQVPEVEEKLFGKGPVEAQLRANLFDGLPARSRAGEVGGGVTGQRSGQDERHHDNPGHARQGRQQAAPDQTPDRAARRYGRLMIFGFGPPSWRRSSRVGGSQDICRTSTGGA